MSEADIAKLTEHYHNFDVWGNDKGTDYSRMEIAYDTSELGYENCVRQFNDIKKLNIEKRRFLSLLFFLLQKVTY